MLVQAGKQLNGLILMVGPEKFSYLKVWTLQKDWRLTGSTAGCTGQIKGVWCLQRVNGEDAVHENIILCTRHMLLCYCLFALVMRYHKLLAFSTLIILDFLNGVQFLLNL